MATVLRLGPGDHGRPMTYDEFVSGDYEEGYRYELIQGELYVSPQPNLPHAWILGGVYRRLEAYSQDRPDVVNWVTPWSRVFIPDAAGVTAPEPDLAAYHDAPLQRKWSIHWREISPVLVVEVLGGEDDEKDLDRNVDLYLRVPSIQEYWIWDIREAPDRLNLKVHRRVRDAWQVLDYGPGDVYSTPLLPGFEIPAMPE